MTFWGVCSTSLCLLFWPLSLFLLLSLTPSLLLLIYLSDNFLVRINSSLFFVFGSDPQAFKGSNFHENRYHLSLFLSSSLAARLMERGSAQEFCLFHFYLEKIREKEREKNPEYLDRFSLFKEISLQMFNSLAVGKIETQCSGIS